MFIATAGQSWADDAHPFNLEVNGTDLIAKVQRHSIRVNMPGPGNNGSLSFTIEDATSTVVVTEWDEVRFNDMPAVSIGEKYMEALSWARQLTSGLLN